MSQFIGRVIVGVHGTPGSLQALRFALVHARVFGAELVPVIAWEPPGGDTARLQLPECIACGLAEAAKRQLLTAFDEGLGGIPDDVQVRPLVVRGQTGHVLVAAADRDTDLLVVGMGEHGPLHRAFSGSPVRYCLAHARCAVVAVPPSRLALELHRAGRRRRHVADIIVNA